MKSASYIRRELQAVDAYKSAAATIGKIEKGMARFGVTRGQFSMIDAILACMEQMNPVKLSIWTWTIADYEVQVIERLIADGRITYAELIIDKAAERKNEAIIDKWRERFGDNTVRWLKNHAKIATLDDGEYQICLRGSFNLNFNPRFENFDWSEGGEAFALVKQIESELPILKPTASHKEIYAASGIGSAFTADQLSIFENKPLKVWNK